MPRKNRAKQHEDFKLKDLMQSSSLVNTLSDKDDRNQEKATQINDVEDRLP